MYQAHDTVGHLGGEPQPWLRAGEGAVNALRRLPLALFYAVDLLVSALTLGAPGQTISARLGKARHNGARLVIPFAATVDLIAAAWPFNEADHCETSRVAYEARLNAAAFGG